MNTVYTITPYEIIELILFVCGAVVSCSAAITVVAKVIQKIKEPEKSQNERIEHLEKKVERFEQLFDNDNKRLIELEKGNRVTQRALLALLSHAINGNNESELKDAKDKLQKYLIDKEEKV